MIYLVTPINQSNQMEIMIQLKYPGISLFPQHRGFLAMIIGILFFITSCGGTTSKEDPLRNTKKLAIKGHSTLWKEGGLQIPMTSVRLIPSGSEALQSSYEMVTLDAYSSLLLAVNEAANSVYVVSDGVKTSYKYAGKITDKTVAIADAITDYTRPEGTLIITKSAADAAGIFGRSFELSDKTKKAMLGFGEMLRSSSAETGKAISEEGTSAGKGIVTGSLKAADSISKKSAELGDKTRESGSDLGADIAQSSADAAVGISEGSSTLGDETRRKGTDLGIGIAKSSIDVASDISESSSRLGDKTSESGSDLGANIATSSADTAYDISEGSSRWGDYISKYGTRSGVHLTTSSWSAAADISSSSVDYALEARKEYVINPIMGYAVIPQKANERVQAVSDALAWENFESAFSKANQARADFQKKSLKIQEGVSENYSKEIDESFKRGDKELETYGEYGTAWALLKSLPWYLKGILWDGFIEPGGKIVTSYLGVLVANGIVFPSMLVYREGVATTNVAVQITWNSLRFGYDLVAPTATAAMGSIYSASVFVCVKVAAAGVAAGGTIAGGTAIVGSRVADISVKSGGKVAAVGVALGGSAAGAVTAVGGHVTGVSLKAGGKVVAAGTVVGGVATGAATVVGAHVADVSLKTGGKVAATATALGGATAGGLTTLSAHAGNVGLNVGGKLTAGTVAVGGVAAGVGTVAVSKTAGALMQGTGYVADKGVQWIGVPIAATTVWAGNTAIEGIVDTTKATGGTGLFIAGELGAATTKVFGTALAGSTMAVGTAVSAVAGTGKGLYQITKAVVVPSSYTLGSGVVLSYSAITHLGAHVVLGVADASYMVLSLEGPRWVLYAVKGDLNSGEDLENGTLLDLEHMQQNGETFYHVPVDAETMKKMIDTTYETLPRVSENQE